MAHAFKLTDEDILELAFTLKNPDCTTYLLSVAGSKYFWIESDVDDVDKCWHDDIVTFKDMYGIIVVVENNELLFIDNDEFEYPSLWGRCTLEFIFNNPYNLKSWNKG